MLNIYDSNTPVYIDSLCEYLVEWWLYRDYTHYEYLFSDQPDVPRLTYAQAVVSCGDFGGAIATVTSPEEKSYVLQYFPPSSP